ncbi:MAG: multifunctional CCA addition/repair protein [Gammaproteobacteria bacterium]|nr:multifunctional CCA addition/repair protein [Gammaproteobacteria bacterium]
MEIYLVGGAVRDKLLNLPVGDRDWVVVGATPEEMEQKGFRLVGKDFPVFLHPETHEEYALARTERKTGPGYKGFAVNASPDVTLEQDLERRDLTINAIAETPDGKIIDPFNGQKDLDNRLLRHVSPAFSEDPVRILRAARFAARFAPQEFHIAHETNELMRDMVQNGEVDALVPERIWAETEKALKAEQPSRFIEVLRGCGALEKIFPEIDVLFGVPQPEHYHPEIDTGVHILMVLDQAARLSDDPMVRFAALVHDLGKGTSPKEEWPRHKGHEQRSAILVEALCQRLRVPKDYRELAITTAKYHTHCHRALHLQPKTILKTLEAADAFRRPERFEQFLLACEADVRGRKGLEDKPYPQVDRLKEAYKACLKIDNKELQQKGFEGESFAEELRRLRIEAIKQVVNED